MDEFGVLTERYGLKPQGKSAPMASARRPNNAAVNSSSSTYKSSSSAYNSGSVNGSFFHDQDSFFNTQKTSNSGGFSGDGFDVFGDFQRNSKQTSKSSNGSSFDYDSIFASSGLSKSTTSFDDDIFGGLSSSGSNRNGVNSGADDIFGSFSSNKNEHHGGTADLLGDFGSKPKATSQNGSVGFDDLIPGYSSSSPSGRSDNNGTAKSSFNSSDDPFGVFESSSSTRTNSTFIDPLEEISKLGHSGSSKRTGSSTFSSPLSPPPKPGQVLKEDKVKNPNVSSIDELEAFAMGKSTNNADARSNAHNAKEVRRTQATKSSKYREAEDGAWQSQQKSPDDLESFFSLGSRSSSAPKSRVTNPDPVFEANVRDRRKPEVTQRKSSGASSGIKKASSATNMVNDLSSIFGDASFFGGEFEEVEGESEERRRARLGRHQRTQERVARAVADMNQRDRQSENEQEERRRIADQMDVDIKSWAAGKEGNMRSLLSSLQYVLWLECGWEPVSLTDLITSSSVKKVYRKATLCVHPDKVQQKGATLQQKYTAEKVFDILKEAWNKFNKEELS